jgi:hypothetical protein
VISITLAVYAAVWSRVFLGDDFGALLFAAANGHPSVALYFWACFTLGGCISLGIGIHAALNEYEEAPLGGWLAAMFACAVALSQGWGLPAAWSAGWWMHASRGVEFAVIAGGMMNLGLTLRARAWWAGYRVGQFAIDDGGTLDALSSARTALQRVIAERDALAERLANLPPARDLESFVEVLGGRRRVLAWLHPDGCTSEAEKRDATARFQKASALLDRKSGRGKQ